LFISWIKLIQSVSQIMECVTSRPLEFVAKFKRSLYSIDLLASLT